MLKGFRIIPVDPLEHGPELTDFLCKVFGNYAERIAITPKWMLEDSFYSPIASRIGIMDGKIVTHYGVFDYQMRVGAARLRTAGIGSVATHWEYRKRGLMDLTIRNCIAGMRQMGFDFSILFGIQNFYEKFGYTRAWSDRELTVTLADLPEPMPAGRIKEFSFERDGEFERLFNRYSAGLTGSAVRPTYHSWNLRKKRVGFRWNDSSRRTTGYVAVEDKGPRVDILEAIGEPEAVLAAIAFIARRFSVDEVRFVCLHHEAPLAKRLRRANCVERVTHMRNGGALARVILLGQALGKMAGELSRRVVAAGLGDYQGTLTIQSGGERVALSIERGNVRVSDQQVQTRHSLRAGDEISQLILGTDDPSEVVEAAKMRLTGDAKFLVPALFPSQYPTLAALDHY
jgi:predicted acetyltransferase